jgi:hypothetical protein
MCVEIVFFCGGNKFDVYKISIFEFEFVLHEIIPLNVDIPFINNSELDDCCYVLQFWNRFAINKPINEVLYMSQFLNKMTVDGYDFSQFSKRCERNGVKITSLKRKNGDVFTGRSVRHDIFPEYTGTEKT